MDFLDLLDLSAGLAQFLVNRPARGIANGYRGLMAVLQESRHLMKP
jgi:hypothetical protein